jgi:predicted NBD/HSP70 family sugar kinase
MSAARTIYRRGENGREVIMRIGIDLGGTKIEMIALRDDGAPLLRRRVPTPARDYLGILDAVADLVAFAEQELAQKGTVGVATPGAFLQKQVSSRIRTVSS